MKNEYNTLFVNLFGGPGLAKSTMAANVFAELKWKNIDCELITEYAKDKVWEGSSQVLADQFYISAKQHHRMFCLNGKVDVVISDSPLLLGLAYSKGEPEEYKNLLVKYHNKFNNLDILLERKKPYHQNGRGQTYEEALEKDEQITKIFNEHCSTIGIVPGSKEGVKIIVDLIMKIKKGS